jgi:hypothetical protein
MPKAEEGILRWLLEPMVVLEQNIWEGANWGLKFLKRPIVSTTVYIYYIIY